MNSNEMQIIAPFGPVIASGYLSDEVLKLLNEDFEKKISDKSGDCHEDLAGYLDIEKSASSEVRDPFLQEIIPLISAYINGCNPKNAENRYNITMTNMWYNEYSGDDFNPLHMHYQDASVLFYLNSFETTERSEKYTRSTASNSSIPGGTIFTHPSTSTLSSSTYCVKPEVGKVLVFPASLLHCVYPAQYLTPRRTGSANFTIELTAAIDVSNIDIGM